MQDAERSNLIRGSLAFLRGQCRRCQNTGIVAGLLLSGAVIQSRPVQNLQLAIAALHQCRATLYPVAVIAVNQAIVTADLRMVDMSADDAIEAAAARFGDSSVFIRRDRCARIFDPFLDRCGQRPVTQSTQAAGAMTP